MTDDNVTPFTPRPQRNPDEDPLEFLFTYHEMDRVLIAGYEIKRLRGKRSPDGATVMFLLDDRFLLEVPNSVARDVAGFVANALAIGEGYPWYGAATKDRPFAPTAIGLGSIPTE